MKLSSSQLVLGNNLAKKTSQNQIWNLSKVSSISIIYNIVREIKKF